VVFAEPDNAPFKKRSSFRHIVRIRCTKTVRFRPCQILKRIIA
jgi:hypothetical protein